MAFCVRVRVHFFDDTGRVTFVLRVAGGDSKTLMVVQVSPVEKNLTETVYSLNFAQGVRTVDLGQATRRIASAERKKKSSRERAVQ